MIQYDEDDLPGIPNHWDKYEQLLYQHRQKTLARNLEHAKKYAATPAGKEARRRASRKYYLNNRERLIASAILYAKKRAAPMSEAAKLSRKQRDRRYYLKNREKILARMRAKKATYPGQAPCV